MNENDQVREEEREANVNYFYICPVMNLLKITVKIMHNYGILLLLLFIFPMANSQKLDYTCYQIGNDYPGNPVHVPHNVADIFVTPEGTLYTNVSWEENGSNVTEVNPDGTITRPMSVGNHGGGEAVTASATHIYFAGDNHRTGNQGIDRRDRADLSEASNIHVDCGDKVYGLALHAGKVYASVKSLNMIRVFDSDLNALPDENITVNSPEDLAFDSEGMLWTLLPGDNKVVKIDPADKTVRDEIVFDTSVIPADIAIDNQNRMWVTDIGPHEQLRIYKNITTDPVFENTFGQEGGMMSGTPGIYGPLKFDMPVGVGLDQDGNVYVANRSGSRDGSTIIQKYTPDGNFLWDLKCVVWIDMMQPVPGNENMVYTSRERMEIDYASQKWNFRAMTMNKHQYPGDYRLTGDNHVGATWIRKLYDQNFMFLTNMPGTRVDIYRFDGEITVPCGYVEEGSLWYDANGNGRKDPGETAYQTTGSTRGFWVDIDGTIWQASRTNGIYKYSPEGMDANGALKYSLSGRTKIAMPSPFTELRRIRFYPEKNNLMIINGFTTGELRNISHHWKRAGKVFRGYQNWNGQFGDPDWELIPPFEDVSGDNGGDGNIQSFEMVDDYLFLAHEGSSADLGISRGTVDIYKTDGSYVGYMTPTEEMGHIGILDITEAMVVYKLSWGPYVIGIEDDGKAKIVVYQWCPTGDCIPSSMKIRLNDFDHDTLYTYNNIVIQPEIIEDTCTIERVEYYANNQLLGSSASAPYAFTLPDTSLGSITIRAKAIADNGAFKWSNEKYVTISNGDPEVAISEPSSNSGFNIFENITLTAIAADYDGVVDSVQFFSGEQHLGTATTDSFQIRWEITEPGEYALVAKAYDNNGQSALSDSVRITAYGYRQADNPENTIHGLIYDYYEGSWDMLPDFSQLISKKKDTIANFDIAQRDGFDEFAFRFYGYINILEKGKYIFYTGSDDGSQLFIGDRLIVDNDGAHGVEEKYGEIFLDSGLHKIKVTMFERQGGEELYVKYEGPGVSKQTVPDSVLFRSQGTPPSISIIRPAHDTLFNLREVIPFKISVSDEDNDVTKTELYTGDYLLGQFSDTSNVMEVNNLATGRHTITARAYDLAGAVTVSDPRYITINGNPEISVISPEDQSEYTRSDTIAVAFTIEDENLEKAEVYINDVLRKTFTSKPYYYELTKSDLGTYFIKIVAIDSLGLETTAKIKISVVNAAPVVSIIRPAGGSVFQTGEQITFKASVSDPDDDVYRVAFFNGESQIGANANLFYETTIPSLPAGEYSIVAKAFDRAGAISESSPLSITVRYPVAVEENAGGNKILIYPNPLKNGDLTIQFDNLTGSAGNTQLTVSDITGRIVFFQSLEGIVSRITVPREIFTGNGLYFIRIKSDKTLEMKKLMVQ